MAHLYVCSWLQMYLASWDGLKRESLREEAGDIVYRGNIFLDLCSASPATQRLCCTVQKKLGTPAVPYKQRSVFDLSVFVCDRSNLLETPFTLFFACAVSSCGRARSGWAQNFPSIHPHMRSAFFLLCSFFDFKCVHIPHGGLPLSMGGSAIFLSAL